MSTRSLLPAVLVLGAAAAGQSTTSPMGFLATEGSSNHSSLLGYNNDSNGSAYCQVDDTQKGSPRTIKALSLRRDGQMATNAAYVARKTRVTLRLGYGDTSKIKPNTPDNGFLVGVPVTVFDRVADLPDLSQKPQSGTAPFNVVFPLDAPFAYDGLFALVTQVRSVSSDMAQNWVPYPLDANAVTTYTTGKTVDYGTSCVTTGRSKPVYHGSFLDNHGPNSTCVWHLSVAEVPQNSPGLILLGGAPADLAIGGCTRLLVTPVTSFPVQTYSSNELHVYPRFLHQPALVGIKLYTQAAMFDPGQSGLPFSLSYGVETTIPSDPVLAQDYYGGGRAWKELTGWPDFSMHRGLSIVVGLHE